MGSTNREMAVPLSSSRQEPGRTKTSCVPRSAPVQLPWFYEWDLKLILTSVMFIMDAS